MPTHYHQIVDAVPVMEVITILMVLMDKSCSTAVRQHTGAN